MKITKKYGTTIYSDNTVSKVTKFKFDNMLDLREFWEITQEPSSLGVWMAQLDNLTVTNTAYVDSSEYFKTLDSLGEEE